MITTGYNRLKSSRSPYLLQHSDQPVWWHEWGDYAFEEAKLRDLPLFVSIGYSSCHWCHVMAHESFDDIDVAEFLNSSFVCIKVDREEHPDIDELFMAVCQVQTGRGGWPLNLFLTPDLKPFYACTYLPRDNSNGYPGFLEVLNRIYSTWRTNRGLILSNSDAILSGVKSAFSPREGEFPSVEDYFNAWEQLQRTIDTEWGGFALAPKFPLPYKLEFLMLVSEKFSDPSAFQAFNTTLEMMRRGGIRDQLAGGYHRYSIDREWRIPHFEKMLYDQAMLLNIFTKGYSYTSKSEYLGEAESIVGYMLDSLQDENGGFYSSEDADSEGVEGAFYLWTMDQLKSALGSSEGLIAAGYFGVSVNGNFENGKNVLYLPLTDSIFAEENGLSPNEFTLRKEGWKSGLLAARSEREKPFLDRKIITEWNGLTIAALAEHYAVTGNNQALSAAVNCLERICSSQQADGRLFRILYEGDSHINATLADYAAMIHACIWLHQATLDDKYIVKAKEMSEVLISNFSAETALFSPIAINDNDSLPYIHSVSDAVIPPANPLLAQTFAIIARIMESDNEMAIAERILAAAGGGVKKHPQNHIYLLLSNNFISDDAVTLTVSGFESDDLRKIIRLVFKKHCRGTVVRNGELSDKPLIQACRKGVCYKPIRSYPEFEEFVDSL